MHRIATWSIVSVLTLIPVDKATAQETEAATALFVKASKVIVRPGEVLENAQVIVRDGIVHAVGQDLEAPQDARVIEGAVVCAAFVDPWASALLPYASARDDKTDAATRTVDAIDVYGGNEERLDALRSGVTIVRTQAGGRSQYGGVGAVVRLTPGAPFDDAVLLADANLATAVGLTKGSSATDVFDRLGELDKLVAELEAGQKYAEDKLEYDEELAEWREEIAEKEEELEKDFKKAKKSRDKKKEEAEEDGKEFKEKRYKETEKPKAPKFDAEKEVLARVVNGELPLVVQAHRAGELRDLLAMTEPFGRVRLIVAGGTEALHVASTLAERNVPVIVWPAPLGSSKADEHDGHDLALAARLDQAGVQVLIGSGGANIDATRDLPLLAAVAVGHGLPREKAFAALTESAARAFDVADRVGTVARGKDAELLVLDGEPLKTTTRVQYVISNGQVKLSPKE